MKKKGINEKGVAIVGVSVRFPEANTLDDFWKNLKNQHSSIKEIPSNRWSKQKYLGDPRRESNKTNSVCGGFIDGADCFDASFFKISPREAMFMDPQQRIALELAWEAIEDAGYNADSLGQSGTGVFMGVCNSDYTELMENYTGELDAYIPTGTSNAILSNRISYWFDFRGPSFSIDTACASSLFAIHQAVQSLKTSECDMALAGGVNLCWSPRRFVTLSKNGMLSKQGECRSFDDCADGYVRGEGGAIVVLKTLHKAFRDRDNIYAVIKGSGINHGGRTNSLTITNPKAHADLITGVYEKALISPDTVSYIETHGPGTPLGDPIEILGLKNAFSRLSDSFNKKLLPLSCGLGSVKTNIGHLESASGIAGILKVVSAMKNKILPANANFQKLNSMIHLEESPFYIVSETKPWELKKSSCPRRAGVSSFGFGGSNAHIILEEYIPVTGSFGRVKVPGKPLLIPLSAKNRECLVEYAKKILKYLKGFPPDKKGPSGKKKSVLSSRPSLRNIAYTLQLGRQPMEERIAFLVSDLPSLIQGLDDFIVGRKMTIFFRQGNIKQGRRITDLFREDQESVDFIGRWIKKRELKKIAELWVNGFNIKWELFYAGSGAAAHPQRRISLPTYPFARERFWLPGPGNIHPSHGGQRSHSPVINKKINTPEIKEVRVRGVKKQESLSHGIVTNKTCGEAQKKFIDKFIPEYVKKTEKSKKAAAYYRQTFSDQRTPVYFNTLLKELHYPITYRDARGPYVYDVDGNEYIDIACDFGANLFGHQPVFLNEALKKQLDKGNALSGRYEAVGEAAELFCELTGHDRVVFCQSGSEAVMSALRIARAFNGKNKFVMFNGSYHGHFDAVLNMNMPGLSGGYMGDTLILEYGKGALDQILKHAPELSAIIVEPVQSRHPYLQPVDFLQSLRQLATAKGIILIFDEVITGFRVHPAGCQGFFGIKADLATYGKILGGGITAGAVAGKKEIMKWVDGGLWKYGDDSRPSPITYIAGTHTQNPLKLAGTLAVLKEIKKRSPDMQEGLNRKTEIMAERINRHIRKMRIPLEVVYFGSLFRFRFFVKQFTVTQALFLNLLNAGGIRYFLHGNCFLTTDHSDRDIDKIIEVVLKSLETLFDEGFFPLNQPGSIAGDRIKTRGNRKYYENTAESKIRDIDENRLKNLIKKDMYSIIARI